MGAEIIYFGYVRVTKHKIHYSSLKSQPIEKLWMPNHSLMRCLPNVTAIFSVIICKPNWDTAQLIDSNMKMVKYTYMITIVYILAVRFDLFCDYMTFDPRCPFSYSNSDWYYLSWTHWKSCMLPWIRHPVGSHMYDPSFGYVAFDFNWELKVNWTWCHISWKQWKTDIVIGISEGKCRTCHLAPWLVTSKDL